MRPYDRTLAGPSSRSPPSQTPRPLHGRPRFPPHPPQPLSLPAARCRLRRAMESLPPDVLYTVLRLAQPSGLPIARLACVSTGFARMAKEHLWRWHCRDQLALDASPGDAQRSDSEAGADAADANAVGDAAAATTVSGEDPKFGRELLNRMLRSMESEEILNLAKLVNVCPGVRTALRRGKVYKAMNCGCSDRSECPCWEPLPSPEDLPDSAPHCHCLRKFEIMAVNRTGAPAVHFLILGCFSHSSEELNDMPFVLIRGIVMDFHSSKMYELASQSPFIVDEQCPYCSSQVWNVFAVLSIAVTRIMVCNLMNKYNVMFPEMLFYVCTNFVLTSYGVEVLCWPSCPVHVQGHLYGLRRLGHDDLAASSAGEAEVEVEISVPPTHALLGGSHSDHGNEDDEEENGDVMEEVLEGVLGRVLEGVMGHVVEEDEAGDHTEPGIPASEAQAPALTVPPVAVGSAVTPELAHAHVVEPAARATAPACAPSAAPVAVSVPAPAIGATSAAASESASPILETAAPPHAQLLHAPQPAKGGSAAAPLSTMVDALSLDAHATAPPPPSASSAAASKAAAPEE
ncbi:unnamed protein product [Closterium sp. Yama58-4]|nr:unnamed protein product [Closterium sp. Yama58-4]